LKPPVKKAKNITTNNAPAEANAVKKINDIGRVRMMLPSQSVRLDSIAVKRNRFVSFTKIFP
jgi:hypothetical protein